MAIIFLVFILALGLAAVLGWTSDTRDSADWSPRDLAPRDRIRS